MVTDNSHTGAPADNRSVTNSINRESDGRQADVRDNAKEIAESICEGLVGVDVLCISARTGVGLKELEAYVTEGKTIVLLGSSGVGKSTLVNRLLCSERLRTKTVRESDNHGRHTTKARELFFLASGAMVIDTPGLREMQQGRGPWFKSTQAHHKSPVFMRSFSSLALIGKFVREVRVDEQRFYIVFADKSEMTELPLLMFTRL